MFPLRGNEVKSFLAALGMVLVAFASLLGCSWHFLFALGPILSDLGRSWGGLGRSSAALRLLLGDLGAVLGHLGAVLGRLGELKTLIFLVFFICFCKIDVLSKHGNLGRS